MNNFIPTNVRKQSKIKLYAKLILGVVIIVLGIKAQSFISIVVGVLFAIGSLFKKDVFIIEEGLFILYDAHFFKHEEVWSFSEMTSIHRDYRHCGADEVLLHFGKDVMVRRYAFKKDIAKTIISMAKEKNPDLDIGDI